MTILGTFLIGGDYDTYVRGFERIVDAYAKADPQLVATLGGDSSKADLARFLAQVAPPLSAAISVLFSAGLMWVAGKAVERSGRLIRPFPIMRDTEMPRRVVVLFGAAIVLASVSLTRCRASLWSMRSRAGTARGSAFSAAFISRCFSFPAGPSPFCA
jgi:hypothetical protein